MAGGFGRSGIIGLGKVQSYQWFASRQQEVFSYIMKIEKYGTQEWI